MSETMTDTAALREAAADGAKRDLMLTCDPATILSLLDELDRLRASPAPDRVSVTVTDEIVKSAFRSFVKARDEFIAAHSAGDKPFDLTTFDLDKCTKHALEAALSEASK